MKQRLTEGDIKKIKDEIEERTLVVRKAAIDAVKEARAQGDLSENFEYYAAKRDKNKNESRIRYLERLLKNAEVIPDSHSEDRVDINQTLTLYYPEDEEEQTIRLVTSIRSDSLKGQISIESPLGRALRGHHVNDTVTVSVNDHLRYDVVIRSIENTGELDSEEISPY